MKRRPRGSANREKYEDKNYRLMLANADYEGMLEAGRLRPSVRATERFWKLKAGSLTVYRANKNRRTHGPVRSYADFLKIRSELEYE